MASNDIRAARKIAKIIVVDDHPMMRLALAEQIAKEPDLEVGGEAEDVDEAMAVVKREKPDLVIVDLSLKKGHGLELIKQISSQMPKVKTLVHSMYAESLYAERALRAGAMGYINKQTDPKFVVEAIRQVLSGKMHLSPEMSQRMTELAIRGRSANHSNPINSLSDRELEVFELLGRGLTASAIANRLHISVHTVDSHRERIKSKLNLSNAAELLRKATQWMLETG